MKDGTMKKLTTIILAILLLAALSPDTAAQDENGTQRLTIPLTNPGRPVTLKIGLVSGGISVEGYDGSEVEIEMSAGSLGDHGGRSRGMRRIPNTSLGLTVEEEDNHVRVSSDAFGRVQRLRLKVPRRTSMELRTVNNGDISVKDIEGELDLKNTNGAITAIGIRGWVVANTTNGDVRVTFDRIQTDKAMSFVSFNGDVDITFPGSLKANLRMKTDRGEIFTDFEFRLQDDGPQVQQEREGGRYRVRLDQEVRATIGGGGQEIYFKTWQGSIYIRKPGA
jgi:hypothetical protein